MLKTKDEHRQNRNTFIVMICTVATRLLGFVRTAIFASLFGMTTEADIINAMFEIPNSLRKLFAEGALSSAFIPVFSAVQHRSDAESRKLARCTTTALAAVLFPFCLLCILLAWPIVSRLLTEYKLQTELLLSVRLFRWFIWYIILISLSAIIMGVLNTHGNFLVPAITPILFSFAVITSLLVLTRSFGYRSMVIGVLAGGLLQFLFQVPWYRKYGYDFKPDINFRNDEFRKVLRLWVPVIGSSSIFVITQILAKRFASGLEQSSISALTYSIVLFQLPYGIFFSSLSTVMVPQMSRQNADENLKGLRSSMNYGIRFLITFLFPSTVVFLFLGKEMIAVVYQGGNFSYQDTLTMYPVFIAYIAGLFGVASFNYFQRFFYAEQNYKIPLLLAAVVAVIDIVLSVLLKETSLRATGLALANSISFSIGAVVLFLIIRKRIGGIEVRSIIVTLFKVVISMFALLAVLVLLRKVLPFRIDEGRTAGNFILFLLTGFISAVFILLMYFLLRIDIIRTVIARSFRKNQ